MRISRAEHLKRFFKRNGYYRFPDEKKRRRKKNDYKKGYEVRLTAYSYKEYKKIKELLNKLEFDVGRSYAKGNRRIIPLYGKENVLEFESLMKRTKITSSYNFDKILS